MCLICVELSKGNLTAVEARRNLSEMRSVVEEEHKIDVLRAIWKKEDQDYQEAQNIDQDDYDDYDWLDWGSD
mgnify:CR=1 FL=1|jgi:hypothetical protein